MKKIVLAIFIIIFSFLKPAYSENLSSLRIPLVIKQKESNTLDAVLKSIIDDYDADKFNFLNHCAVEIESTLYGRLLDIMLANGSALSDFIQVVSLYTDFPDSFSDAEIISQTVTKMGSLKKWIEYLEIFLTHKGKVFEVYTKEELAGLCGHKFVVPNPADVFKNIASQPYFEEVIIPALNGYISYVKSKVTEWEGSLNRVIQPKERADNRINSNI